MITKQIKIYLGIAAVILIGILIVSGINLSVSASATATATANAKAISKAVARANSLSVAVSSAKALATANTYIINSKVKGLTWQTIEIPMVKHVCGTKYYIFPVCKAYDLINIKEVFDFFDRKPYPQAQIRIIHGDMLYISFYDKKSKKK